MNLAQLREYEQAHDSRVHQSAIRDEPPATVQSTVIPVTTVPGQSPGGQVSEFCNIRPGSTTTHHGRCHATWCACPCHEDYCGYGMMCE